MNEVLQTLTEEQRKAVDWMIKNNLQDFCDSVKSGIINPNTTIAKIFHVSERIIGLTIVAFGTSLPELATSCIASFKRQNDIAVGNIIGSNIFNILFVLGLTGLIRPIPFEHVFLFDCFVALMAAVGLFFYTCRTKTLTKFQGLSFLLLYVFYLGYLIIK